MEINPRSTTGILFVWNMTPKTILVLGQPSRILWVSSFYLVAKIILRVFAHGRFTTFHSIQSLIQTHLATRLSLSPDFCVICFSFIGNVRMASGYVNDSIRGRSIFSVYVYTDTKARAIVDSMSKFKFIPEIHARDWLRIGRIESCSHS